MRDSNGNMRHAISFHLPVTNPVIAEAETVMLSLIYYSLNKERLKYRLEEIEMETDCKVVVSKIQNTQE